MDISFLVFPFGTANRLPMQLLHNGAKPVIPAVVLEPSSGYAAEIFERVLSDASDAVYARLESHLARSLQLCLRPVPSDSCEVEPIWLYMGWSAMLGCPARVKVP